VPQTGDPSTDGPAGPVATSPTTRALLHEVPERALRSILLTLSHRRWLGRVATDLPITRPMVARFVAGQTLDEALDAIASVRDQGMRTTVDVLGESVTSPDDARAAADRYLQTLAALAARGLERNVSLKLTQMGLEVDRDLCRENVSRILRRAGEIGAFVRIDMEDHTKVDATLDLWRELRPIHDSTGVVIQAALRRSAADVDRLIEEHAPIRLCKGAYKEPAAVAFVDKVEVDQSYAQLMERLLRDGTSVALATHDERLIKRAVAIVRRDGIPRDRFEFQMLYGVRRDLQERLAGAGFTVRVYVPYGSQWYPYFMRRLAERPANVAFILRSLVREGSGPHR
jgi:proline dehydrogenase